MANLFENIGNIGQSGTDIIDQAAAMNFAGENMLKIAGPLLQLLVWVAVLALGGIIVYKIFIEYNIKVSLRYMTRGGSIVDIKRDKAKLVKDKQGKTKLEFLLNKKLKCPPIPRLKYKYKSGSSDYYEFVIDDNGSMFPCEIAAQMEQYDSENNLTEGIYKTKSIPEERLAWLNLERKSSEEKFKKKDWMEKYGQVVVTMSVMLMIILVMFFMFNTFNEGFKSAASSWTNMAMQCSKMYGG